MAILTPNDLINKKFLFIENDPFLSDIDRNNIEYQLVGLKRDEYKLDDFDITYHFNSFSDSIETWEEFLKYDYILLNTNFTGDSEILLQNFMNRCKKMNINNKIIINCTKVNNKSLLHTQKFIDIFNDLEKNNNIRYFEPSRNMFAFVQINDPDFN